MCVRHPSKQEDIAIQRIRAEITRGKGQLPSTIYTREATLAKIPWTLCEAEEFPELLADIAVVLREQVSFSMSNATSLFDMARSSEEVQRHCVRQIGLFDIERRLAANGLLAGDERLLRALSKTIKQGNIVDSSLEEMVGYATFDHQPSTSKILVTVLDQLLFAASPNTVRRNSNVLKETRDAVINRILKESTPDDVDRTDARAAAVLLTHPQLGTGGVEQANAVIDKFEAASEPLVQFWGRYIRTLLSDRLSQDRKTQPRDLVNRLKETIAAAEKFKDDRDAVAIWGLGRAIAQTSNPEYRNDWIDVLSTIKIFSNDDLHLEVFETLYILTLADVLVERDLPILFERLQAAIASFSHAKTAAIRLLQALVDKGLTTEQFINSIFYSIILGDEIDGGLTNMKNILYFDSLVKATQGPGEGPFPVIVDALERGPGRHLIGELKRKILYGNIEEVELNHPGELLCKVASITDRDRTVFDDTFEDLLEAVFDSKYIQRKHSHTAIRYAAEANLLGSGLAERYLSEYSATELASGAEATHAAAAIISNYDSHEKLDLDAFIDALGSRIPDADWEESWAIRAALESIALLRTFGDPEEGIEFIGLWIDAASNTEGTPSAVPDDVFEALPATGSTASLTPLVERIQSENPNIRHQTIALLNDSIPREFDSYREQTEQRIPPLTGTSVQQLVHPLVEQISCGDNQPGFRSTALNVLAGYVERNWLTNEQIESVVSLARSLLHDDPENVAILLQVPQVVDQLGVRKIKGGLEQCALALEPTENSADRSGETLSLDGDLEAITEALVALSKSGNISPSDIVDVLNDTTRSNPSLLEAHAADLIPLLERNGVVEQADPSVAQSLDRAISNTVNDEEDLLKLLRIRTRVQKVAIRQTY
ncbi:hypothetical protein [Halorubellus litoreus]|uniref:HEAT repeat-containing protein n=1 Tax=Halorubellus litoreus TaxID=755308 RepID=A0ABD5VJC4_9EURY